MPARTKPKRAESPSVTVRREPTGARSVCTLVVDQDLVKRYGDGRMVLQDYMGNTVDFTDAYVRITGRCLQEDAEATQIVMADARELAEAAGAAHVFVDAPRIIVPARAAGPVEGVAHTRTPRESVAAYLEAHPPPDDVADDVREAIETVLVEEGL